MQIVLHSPIAAMPGLTGTAGPVTLLAKVEMVDGIVTVLHLGEIHQIGIDGVGDLWGYRQRQIVNGEPIVDEIVPWAFPDDGKPTAETYSPVSGA